MTKKELMGYRVMDYGQYSKDTGKFEKDDFDTDLIRILADQARQLTIANEHLKRIADAVEEVGDAADMQKKVALYTPSKDGV